ncbi:MAG: lysoplasmalogenase [Candidatus Marinimicrobia bacterium]|nr:lysoplasmalogenase [Candidatus Neomarinimicrobiota bacterium]
MVIPYILIVILIATVTLLIRAEINVKKKQIYLFKPISTILLIAVVSTSIISGNYFSLHYSQWILLALLLCLFGDIALMFQENLRAFQIGLVFFLVAHGVYALAFFKFSGGNAAPLGMTVSLAIIGAIGYFYLYPKLGLMKLPVLVYILIITYMLNRAMATHFCSNFNHQQAWLISVGASLFYISDFMLAVNRFRWSFKYNRISLAFYYSGQLFIALSTLY